MIALFLFWFSPFLAMTFNYNFCSKNIIFFLNVWDGYSKCCLFIFIPLHIFTCIFLHTICNIKIGIGWIYMMIYMPVDFSRVFAKYFGTKRAWEGLFFYIFFRKIDFFLEIAHPKLFKILNDFENFPDPLAIEISSDSQKLNCAKFINSQYGKS